LQNVNVDDTIRGIETAVQILSEKTEELIVSTIPPIPKLMVNGDDDIWKKISDINTAILKCAGKRLTVLFQLFKYKKAKM
jgi:hypothetical protein